MSLTITPADRLISQTHTNGDRRRRPRSPDSEESFEIGPPSEQPFDSPTPASIEFGTEAAIADLEQIDEMPLAAVVRLYKDET